MPGMDDEAAAGCTVAMSLPWIALPATNPTSVASMRSCPSTNRERVENEQPPFNAAPMPKRSPPTIVTKESGNPRRPSAN